MGMMKKPRPFPKDDEEFSRTKYIMALPNGTELYMLGQPNPIKWYMKIESDTPNWIRVQQLLGKKIKVVPAKLFSCDAWLTFKKMTD